MERLTILVAFKRSWYAWRPLVGITAEPDLTKNGLRDTP